MSQNDLNFRGKDSDKLFVLIFIIIPKEKPIEHLLINNIIQEGITLNKLKKDMANKEKIIISFLTNLLVKNPQQRFPKAINNISELETSPPLIGVKL